jgi:hypothetical protein
MALIYRLPKLLVIYLDMDHAKDINLGLRARIKTHQFPDCGVSTLHPCVAHRSSVSSSPPSAEFIVVRQS